MAQSGHHDRGERCPLLGEKRTSARLNEMSAFDPKRTWYGSVDLAFDLTEICLGLHLGERSPRVIEENNSNASCRVFRRNCCHLALPPSDVWTRAAFERRRENRRPCRYVGSVFRSQWNWFGCSRANGRGRLWRYGPWQEDRDHFSKSSKQAGHWREHCSQLDRSTGG